MEHKIIYLVQQLLKENNIYFDSQEFAFQIESHPTFPSLHSITGVLDHFNIDSLALDIPVNKIDEELILQLPACFLTQTEIDGVKDFVLIIRNKVNYTVIRDAKDKQKLNALELSSVLTGIIVAVEQIEEQENKNNQNVIVKNTLGVLIGIGLIGLLFIGKGDVFSLSYFVLSITGLLVSIAIVKQELGVKTNIGNAFCSQATEKKDCNAVLKSKGSMLFKIAKLSDLSVVYFSGLSILSFLCIVQAQAFTLLYMMSVVTFPIVIYTLLYQKFKLKQWCTLCLLVSGLLFGKMAVVLMQYSLFSELSMSLNSGLIMGLVFLMAILIVKMIRSFSEELKGLRQDKIEGFKFKRNAKLFKTLIGQEQVLQTEIRGVNEIVLGNKKGPLQIIIITNPFCAHCKGVHELVENIMHSYSESVGITIRFLVNTDDLESDGAQVTSRLLELFDIYDTKKCLVAMHDIYGEVTVDDWLKKWGKCNNIADYIQVLNKESDWCKSNAINFTPEILVNGKSFPKEYDRKDLIYFIEDLAEEARENKQVITHMLV